MAAETDSRQPARWATQVLLALWAVMTMVAQAAWADELKPFRASYGWVWHGMNVAVSTLTLERSRGDWVYGSKSDPRGLGRMFAERPVQASVIRVTDAGVEPLSYKADDGTTATKRDADLTFNWDSGRVTGVYEDARVDLPLQPGIQDDLSVQIALMVELLRGHTPRQFQIIDRNSVREYHYEREREETLATPIGSIATVVFRAQKSGSPRATRFWCAPSHGFIPMRVEQKRGEDIQWTLQIESLKRE